MLIVNILQILLLLGPSAIFISLLSNRVKIGLNYHTTGWFNFLARCGVYF